MKVFNDDPFFLSSPSHFSHYIALLLSNLAAVIQAKFITPKKCLLLSL